jgi:predicted DNA-binding protein (UPF0251 family)
MSGRMSAETTEALRLVKEEGLSAYAAAKKVGIALSTIYRAQAREAATRKRKKAKRL